jgi:hypothetical protein
MRPTIRGLLFRTFRMLFILTMITGTFSVVLSALESYLTLQQPQAPGGPSDTPAGGGPSPR